MKILMETRDLKRIIKATKKFVSKDFYRKALQYIRFDFDKDTKKLKATALDGIMLSVEYADIAKIDESFSVYVKPYLPIGMDSEWAEITVNDGTCYITVGERGVSYKQPDIEWLDTDKLIKDLEKKEVISSIYFDNEKLADLLKSIDKCNMQEPTIIEFRGENKPILVRFKDNVRMLQVMRSEQKESAQK